LYQGQVGSTDIFGQQHYLYETDYTRADIEPDKLFTEKNISKNQSNLDIIHQFPLAQRVDAYWEIGKMKPALTLASCSLSPHNRTFSDQLANSFISFRSVSSFEQLKKLFKQENDRYIKEQLEEALKAIYTPLQLQLRALQDENTKIRSITAVKLGYLGSTEAVQLLVKLLQDSDSEVRSSAMDALGQLGASQAVLALLPLLQDSDSNVRSSAADALGQLGDSQAVPSLLQLLNDRNRNVRKHAAYALIELGHPQAVSILMTLLKNLTVEQEIIAKATLSELQPDNSLLWQSFMTLLQSEPTWVKIKAINFINELPDGLSHTAKRQLHHLFADPEITVRLKAVRTLAKSVTPDSSEPAILLEKFTQLALNPQENLTVRLFAIKALGKLPVNAETLIDLVNQETGKTDNESLIYEAYRSLGQTRASPVAIKFLRNQLRQLERLKQDWRSKRDEESQRTTLQSNEDTQLTISDCPQQAKQGNADKQWRYPHWETTLGYSITQLDPNPSGIELLSHHLFNVRQGAWLALGTMANVDLLKQLNQQRDASQFVIFVDAAYRALDKSLITLGVKGTAQDLEALQKWSKIITDKAVKERVEWTILDLEYHLQLKKQVGWKG
jgi:HEAT repeat protein